MVLIGRNGRRKRPASPEGSSCGWCSTGAYLCIVVIEGGEQRRIWLTVRDDHRLDQVIKQLGKPEDVREVRRATQEERIFTRIEALLS